MNVPKTQHLWMLVSFTEHGYDRTLIGYADKRRLLANAMNAR